MLQNLRICNFIRNEPNVEAMRSNSKRSKPETRPEMPKAVVFCEGQPASLEDFLHSSILELRYTLVTALHHFIWQRTTNSLRYTVLTAASSDRRQSICSIVRTSSCLGDRFQKMTILACFNRSIKFKGLRLTESPRLRNE